jgi:hypothetical protein
MGRGNGTNCTILALTRRVSVKIIVSRDRKEEGDRGLDGGYSSDYDVDVRKRILSYVSNPQNIDLKVYNYPSRNHAKVVIVDKQAFHIGAQNLYPTKYPILTVQKAIDMLTAAAFHYDQTVYTVSAVIAMQCLSAIVGRNLDAAYEVGLGECGIIVCDGKKTEEFIQSYWNPKWSVVHK